MLNSKKSGISESQNVFERAIEEDEHTISAFGDVAASEINFIRCTSPEILELPRQNPSPIKRPVPPSRRKVYGDIEDFTALCDSLRIVRDQTRVSSEDRKPKSHSFEQQISLSLSESQIPSYSGPIRNTHYTKPQQPHQLNVPARLTCHREYDLPGPLRLGAEQLARRL